MKTTVAAIDFGTSKIVTLVAENSGSQRCDIVAAGVAKYDGYLEEGWNNPGQLDEAIRRSITDAEEQAGSKIREINVGVPGAFTHVYATKVTISLAISTFLKRLLHLTLDNEFKPRLIRGFLMKKNLFFCP